MSSIFQGQITATGRVHMELVPDPDTVVPTGYFRGLAMGEDGFLASVVDTADPRYVNGLRTSQKGVLIVVVIAGGTFPYNFAPGAAPQMVGDKLIIVDSRDIPTSLYHNGIPYFDLSGYTAIMTSATPLESAIFSNGFDDGFEHTVQDIDPPPIP